ncbi:MAG: amidase [Burkholderiaceae bacterium]
MNFSEYLTCDATRLATLVARREVSADELLALALGQHQRTHARINAICRPMEAEARTQLAGPPLTGPFAGVPFLLKDGVQDVAGLPTGYGSAGMRHIVPTHTAHVVRRYLDAGLVVFGKTNMPEFALKGVTDPRVAGRTNNPWNLGHTPGGSSGGAAAAIAAGVVPMAAGADGGGSIRIPAACCGLFGLRPSRGRVSSGPGLGEAWFGASSEGVLSRSVRDTARALDAIAGPQPGDPFTIAPPTQPYADAMQQAPRRLRIGFTTTSPLGTPVHAQAVAAVADAARLLASLGHDVDEAAPDIDGPLLARNYLHVYFGQVPAAMARAYAAGAKRGEFELLTRIIETLGKATSAATLTTQLGEWNLHARALAAYHQRFDLLLTPTLAHPPVTHGAGDPPVAQQRLLDVLDRTGLLGVLARAGLLASTVDQIATDSLQYVPFTQLANLTGTPAMSVPLYWTADGLPLGVQFVAPFGQEDVLLQLAAQLEQARPWFGRLPAWVTEGR